MDTNFLDRLVTHQQILDALNEFASQYPNTDSYDSWLEKKTYKYAVQYDGRLYPPKYILSRAMGISTNDFSGGKQTNQVFRQLGFDVVNK